MKTKNIILSAAGVALIIAVSLKLANNKEIINEKAEQAIVNQQFDVIPVKTTTVQLQNINTQLSESGTFKAAQELKLMAQSQGLITRLNVKKTQFVRKGMLIATIDNSSLISQQETGKASLEKAKDDAQRYENALKAGGVSKQQVEEAQLRVQNAETQLASLRQQSRNFQIISPMNGIINDVLIEAGSVVSPGTPLVEIVDITNVNLSVRVDQKSLPNIQLGQKVKVTSDVYPEKVFRGTVATVNVKTDLSQKIEVGVSVTNDEKTPLLAGMYGHADFMTNKKQAQEEVLVIPRAAIIGSVQDAKVFVVNNGKTTLVTVTTGRILDNNVEIISGLTKGQEVVTAGQINLENGTKVSVSK